MVNLPQILNYGKDFISTFSDLLQTEEMRSILQRSGTIISLLVTTIEIIEKYKKSKLSEEEKAYLQFSEFVLKTFKESCESIGLKQHEDFKKIEIEHTIEKDYQDERYLEDISNWDGNLINHPLIKKFLKSIEKSDIIDEDKKNDLLNKFQKKLISKSNDDSNYTFYRDWWEKNVRWINDLEDYLHKIVDLKNYKRNNKKLEQCYIYNRAIILDRDTFDLTDDDINLDYPTKNIFNILSDFIKQKDNRQLIVSSSFGIGKTSFVRMFSAYLAEESLSNKEEQFSIPIPIPISLNYDDYRVIFNDKSYRTYKNILESIIDPIDKSGRNIKLLLILDGLDEYKGTELINNFINNLEKYKFLKIVITTRTRENLLEKHNILFDTYVRLLPFDENQLSEFFEKCKIKIDTNYLKYQFAERLDLLDLPIELLKIPVFAYIFDDMETKNIKISQIREWNKNMKRSFLVMMFLHNNILSNSLSKLEYINERKILRLIAGMKQLSEQSNKNEKLTLELLKLQHERLNADNSYTNNFLIEITESSYFLSIHSDYEGRIVDFTLNTIFYYLTAEYYFERFFEQNSSFKEIFPKINIGLPSYETINFFEGLMDLLIFFKNNDNDNVIYKFYQNFLKTFTNRNINESIESIEINILKNIHEDYPSICYDSNALDNIKAENKWLQINFPINFYKNLWIYKWISLCAFGRILEQKPDKAKLIKKHKLSQLINSSSQFIPPYLKKLKWMDLSGENLSNANLFRADLSNSDLTRTILFRADLSSINLHKSKLINTDLSDVNMSDANLSESSMLGTFLPRANLADTNFTKSNIYKVKLCYAILTYANLESVHISKSNLSYANLTDANLINSYIRNSDISYANFSDSNLSKSRIKNTIKNKHPHKYMICNNIDFNRLKIIGDEELYTYIEECLKQQKFNLTIKEIYPDEPNLTIKEIYPDENAKNVSLGGYVSITFNNSLDECSFKSSLHISRDDGSEVKGNIYPFSNDKKKIIFVPSKTLELDAKYRVEVSADEIKDIFKNTLQENKRWSFFTKKSQIPIFKMKQHYKRLHILDVNASNHDGNLPLNVLDNDLSKRWSGNGIGSWILLGLGQKSQIFQIDIAWFKGDKREYYYKILFLKDKNDTNIDFETPEYVSYKTLYPQSINCLRDNQLIPARFIKIIINGNSTNSWASITKIDIFGISNQGNY